MNVGDVRAGKMSKPLALPRIALHITPFARYWVFTCFEGTPTTSYMAGMRFNPKTIDGKHQGFFTLKVEKVRMFTFPFPLIIVLSSPGVGCYRLDLVSPPFSWERSQRKDYREVLKAFKKND